MKEHVCYTSSLRALNCCCERACTSRSTHSRIAEKMFLNTYHRIVETYGESFCKVVVGMQQINMLISIIFQRKSEKKRKEIKTVEYEEDTVL